ncbi:MAG: tetratricopeptide repeat protein [Rivularia sp. (in: cyanobacteria)]
MRYQRFALSLLTIVTVISTPVISSLEVPFGGLTAWGQTNESKKAEADKLFEKALEQAKANQLQAALRLWQQALKIYREIKDRQGEAAALGNIGLVYYSLRDYVKAISYLEQYLTIAREIKDRQGEINTLNYLGHAYKSIGNYAKAIEYYKKYLLIAKEIKDVKAEEKTLSKIGVIYEFLGDYAKAIQYYKQSLAITKEIKDPKAEGEALGNLGIVHLYLGKYTKSMNYFQQHLAIAREIEDPGSEAMALTNIGIVFRNLGNYIKAIEYQKQSLAIYRKIKDRKAEGGVLNNLGLAYSNMGNYAQAIKYLQEFLVITKEFKDREKEAKALGNLGTFYQSIGDYAKAINYHEQNLAIAREIKDRKGEGIALGNLGIAYGSLRNYTIAIEYQKQSLAIAREIQDRRSVGEALGDLANAYHSFGNYAQAIEYSEQYLTIARQIQNRRGEAIALGNLGLSYFYQENYAKAIEYSKQYLAIAKEIKYRQGESIAFNNLGLALYKSGKLSVAERTLFEGIKVSESLRGGLSDAEKVLIFEQLAQSYVFLQKILITQNKTDTALEIAERGRARAFVELLASRLNLQQKPQAPKLEEIKQIAKAQNATLVQYSIIYDNFKVAGKQQAKESQLYIWVIKPTGEITFRKADLKHLWKEKNTTLDELVSITRKSLGVSDDERSIFDVKVKNPVNEKIQKKSLQRLHQLLVTPIADLLPTDPNQRITFVPQSSLFLVPFPALQDAEGKYLIEKHTILTAPSIQVLDLTRKQRNRVSQIHQKSVKQDILIVGNPTMPSVLPEIGAPPKQLPSLPGAETEAKEIAKLFNTKPLIGKDATETIVRQRFSEAKIIHLATHGLLDDFKDGNVPGAIALAPNGKDNGLLTANEIFDLQINADLVVLSACDTGQGKLTGDGVIGLSRSLISAGAPSVVVTLWTIPDNPTAMLMTEFYRQLQQNPDKARALRQAMLTTMKKHQNPRDWAAFTLIGEAK